MIARNNHCICQGRLIKVYAANISVSIDFPQNKNELVLDGYSVNKNN
jgi:hypothetical protein